MTQFLSDVLRNQLAKTVQAARRVGEAGARQAIRALAVDRREPHDSMTSTERVLRRRLRVHGRQLGDRRDSRTGSQETTRLTHEVAYEHWHRMLFARFLAENQLLIEPDSGVAISLDECEELARERGKDRWTLAGGFAQRMLPRIFRPDAPALAVRLAPENRQALERLVESLPAELFAAADSLGWVYQFWQSEKKNQVNRSEDKIGADQLPAVTQLFTEPYMVHFLLDNGLGAWWAARRLSDSDLEEAGSEAELRRNASIPGVALDYLRFVRRQEAVDGAKWRIASGNFDGWPEHLGELKILDPCCGSGHFLVAALSMLVPLRMERERLNARAAVDAVLAGEPARIGVGPALRRAGGVRPRTRRLEVSRRGRIPPSAGAQSGLLRCGAQRDEGTVVGAGGTTPQRPHRTARTLLFGADAGFADQAERAEGQPLPERLQVGSGTVASRAGRRADNRTAGRARRGCAGGWLGQRSCWPDATTG